MNTSTNRKKWKKVILISFIGLFSILLLLTIGGYFFLTPLLTKIIKEKTLAASDSVYQVSFSKIQYNPAFGYVEIHDLKLTPDTAAYERLHIKQKASDALITLEVPRINMTGVFPLSLIFSKKLELNNVLIKQPTVKIVQQKHVYNKEKVTKPLHEALSKFLRSFRINNIIVDDVNFALINKSDNKVKPISFQHLNINVIDVIIDSLSFTDPKRIYYAQDYTIRLKRLDLPAKKNSLFDIKLGEVLFSVKRKYLSVDSIYYKPLYSEMEFAGKADGANRIELLFKNIQIYDIDVDKFIQENKLYAKKLTFDGGRVNVFKHSGFPGDRTIKIGKYPHQRFRKLDFKVNIDTLLLKNVNVGYGEYNPELKQIGRISFNRIVGKLVNVTNDTIPLQKSPICHADFNTYFMNKGNLNVHFGLNIAAPKGDFTCHGQLGAFDGVAINKTTTALAKIKIESLQVDKYVFKMRGNDYRVEGTGTLYYHNFVAVLLKEKSNEDKRLKRKAVVSFLANNLVLKDANPSTKGKTKGLRTGTISHNREPTKSFFNALWKGILDSLKDCVISTR